MSKFIYGLILIWFCAFSLLVIFNDFAIETIDFTYPALGTILLSAFLGFKSIVLDAPAIEKVNVPVGILLDGTSGQIYSLNRATVDNVRDSFAMNPTRLFNLEILPFYEKFKSLNLTELLREPQVTGSVQIPQTAMPHEDYLNARDELMLEGLEFVFLEWLTYQQVPSWLNERDFQQGILSTGGSSRSLVPESDMETKLKISSMEIPNNRFLAALPLEGVFPSRTTIHGASNLAHRVINITTKFSKMEIEFTRGGGGVFQDFNKMTRNIVAQNQLPMGHAISESRYRVSFSFSLFPLTRFSREAKLHPKWFGDIVSTFRSQFSFDEILKRYKD